jgi:transposase
MQDLELDHRKYLIGASPIIDSVMRTVRLSTIIGMFIRNVRYIQALEVLIKSILMAPAALYRIPAWIAQFEPDTVSGTDLDDDTIGRALDALFSCDRATLQTRITMELVRKYDVDTDVIHNDSTSIKFHGAYRNQSPRGVQLKRGHSKDHRPDLKQIIYNLSVTEDGAIPVHFKCFDGNRTDDTLHIETWLTLRGMLGRSDFIYVADSKLCTSENMCKINKEGGRFVTIVPDTRAENAEFEASCFAGQVQWRPLTRRQLRGSSDSFDVFEVAEGNQKLREGFDVFWYRSSEKRRRDAENRRDRIESTMEKLSELSAGQRRGPKSGNALLKKAQDIIARYASGAWIEVKVTEQIDPSGFRKCGRGRPTAQSKYVRVFKPNPRLEISKNIGKIAQSETMDGVFPLVTNASLNAKDTLLTYKYQPNLEKRFSCMKSDYQIAPVFLKKNTRIEALMFVCFIADMIAAIVQRNLRLAMAENNIETLNSLPEERPSKTPTWEHVQRLFASHSKYKIFNGDTLLKTFWDPLSQNQRAVLSLLKVPTAQFCP